jgi:ubiquinone/menaquinone biosynthesis C-methylase UbiE
MTGPTAERAVDGALTERQQRELDYHREHAQKHRAVLEQPFSYDVIESSERRPANAYWRMYDHLMRLGVAGRDVLVVGCGFGEDALRLAKLGANVRAFDLSGESLDIAERLARREGLSIRFDRMPAESLDYPDATIDLILARDILHHVDIARTLPELRRVARPGAWFVMNEVYSHSWTDRVRRSRFVDGFLYPRMQKFVYGDEEPYITEDERKLTERDVAAIEALLDGVEFEEHFNFLVNRVVPEAYEFMPRLDRWMLRRLKPFGRHLAARILLGGRVAR